MIDIPILRLVALRESAYLTCKISENGSERDTEVYKREVLGYNDELITICDNLVAFRRVFLRRFFGLVESVEFHAVLRLFVCC